MERISDLFKGISDSRALYLPVNNKNTVNYGKWEEGVNFDLNTLRTVKSAKDLFFPQTEDLVSFKVQGKNISIDAPAEPDEKFVIFGVRACDAKSFEILDRVFLSEPVDSYYKARRENGIVITLACNQPEETCFCSVFGIDPANPGGDISSWIADGFLYMEAVSEKGEKFMASLDMLEDGTKEDIKETQENIAAIMKKLPLADLDLTGFDGDATDKLFNSKEWEKLSKTCIGCGTCTFVCPTCQCYDIRDFDTGEKVCRYRCWDSCMYSDFTRMAHGNPRKSQLERFRQRFMHKLVYFPANNDGMYSCVGCGRCLAKCPISMNIVKVIKALSAEAKR